jgi:hypothetical protein
MSEKMIEMARIAIGRGSLDEGARLLRLALAGELGAPLSPQLRAVAYLWLAETTTDAATVRACVSAAMRADPDNAEAQRRLAALLAPPPPAPAYPTQPPAPAYPAQVVYAQGYPAPVYFPAGYTPAGYTPPAPPPAPAVSSSTPAAPADHVAQIIGGAQDGGLAVWLADGLLMTTRTVVGASTRVTVNLRPARQIAGVVVRSHPELDLAFISVEHRLTQYLPVTPLSAVEAGTPLLVLGYMPEGMSSDAVRTKRGAVRRVLAQPWVPLDLTAASFPHSSGGEAVFDERGYLVGLLTRLTVGESGHLMAVHISAVRRALDALVHARDEKRAYCPACGTRSQAFGHGLAYCEGCGTLAPTLRERPAAPGTQAGLFTPVSPTACRHCGANVGIYRDMCLRCGRAQKAAARG